MELILNVILLCFTAASAWYGLRGEVYDSNLNKLTVRGQNARVCIVFIFIISIVLALMDVNAAKQAEAREDQMLEQIKSYKKTIEELAQQFDDQRKVIAENTKHDRALEKSVRRGEHIIISRKNIFDYFEIVKSDCHFKIMAETKSETGASIGIFGFKFSNNKSVTREFELMPSIVSRDQRGATHNAKQGFGAGSVINALTVASSIAASDKSEVIEDVDESFLTYLRSGGGIFGAMKRLMKIPFFGEQFTYTLIPLFEEGQSSCDMAYYPPG